MTNKKPIGKSMISLISALVIIAVIAAVIGIVYRFTNGFNEDFKTFYLERDGEQILMSDTETSFKCGQSYRYEVKYTFDSGDAEPKGFNVKVMPNTDLAFSFTAGGKQYPYADAKELTDAFDIVKEDGAFTISIPIEFSLKSVLEKVYGKEVEVEDRGGYLYTLVVSSYNDRVTYNIDFGIITTVTGIETNKGSITFGAGDMTGGSSG